MVIHLVSVHFRVTTKTTIELCNSVSVLLSLTYELDNLLTWYVTFRVAKPTYPWSVSPLRLGAIDYRLVDDMVDPLLSGRNLVKEGYKVGPYMEL